MSWLDTAHRRYREAAAKVQPSACCVSVPRFRLPGLVIPAAKKQMNHGCGTTVHLQDRSPALDVLESVEVVAIRSPAPADGPCIFAGETVSFVGADERFDERFGDGSEHVIERHIPLDVCRKTAANPRALGRSDLIVTPATWHYAGDGCC